MKKKKKIESKYIFINLAIYRCYVVVTWEQNVKKIINVAKRNGVKNISEDWEKEFTETMQEATGLCMELGDKNNDCLVWIKERPKKASQFGVLYHELFHAVQHVAKTHAMDMHKEIEATAYIYEFLANRCNNFLWK